MTSQFTETFTGSFVSTGNPFQLALPSGVDYFILKNVSQWGASADPGVVVEAVWHQAMTPGEALATTNTTSGNGLNADLIAAPLGFTPYADTGEVLEK